ncbi:MAG: hypothetical protein AB8B87_01115 [Granulosicoccus sp.]
MSRIQASSEITVRIVDPLRVHGIVALDAMVEVSACTITSA